MLVPLGNDGFFPKVDYWHLVGLCCFYIGTEYFISSGFWWHFDRCGLELSLVIFVLFYHGSSLTMSVLGGMSSFVMWGCRFLLCFMFPAFYQ